MKRINADTILGVLFGGLGVFIWVWSARWIDIESYDPIGPAYFPRFMAAIIVGMSAVLVLQSLLTVKSPAHKPDTKGVQPWVYQLGSVLLACSAYLILMNPLGYIISTFAFLGVLIIILGVRNWKTVAKSSLFLTAFLYLLFAYVLGVLLPDGILAVIFS